MKYKNFYAGDSRTKLIDRLLILLPLVSHQVPRSKLRTWTTSLLHKASNWAFSTHLRASDNNIRVRPKPKVLNGYEFMYIG